MSVIPFRLFNFFNFENDLLFDYNYDFDSFKLSFEF